MLIRRVLPILAVVAIFPQSFSVEVRVKHDMKHLIDEVNALRIRQENDVNRLMAEIKELKSKSSGNGNLEMTRHNEDVIRGWCKSSVKDLHAEFRDLFSSDTLDHLHIIGKEVENAIKKTAELAQLGISREHRVAKLETDIANMQFDTTELKNSVVEISNQVYTINKTLKKKDDLGLPSNNEAFEDEAKIRHGIHKVRHSKNIQSQVAHITATQQQQKAIQETLQVQMQEVERRINFITDVNWDLFTAKLQYLDLETQSLRCQMDNTTQQLSDFNKIHASILQLREDIENIENKADTTIPDFRKEISKLDMNYAQMHAQASYLKEDQENLRQSVKAIAVSVSNAMDRAEMDRLAMSHINETINDLQSTSKQHFYRLNDHILKSEQQSDDNNTHIITLPELMEEVKELRPVQNEYEDLVKQLPKDCSNITGKPGTYLIHPGHTPIDANCDNGSTLLQRRFNGTVEFNRNFREYVKGFGDPNGEYWLGLQSIHQLTADNCTSMRIDMTDIYGGIWYAVYETFTVGSADTGYVLTVEGYHGNASDAFEYQNHMEFSAKDRDRDISNIHCAGNYEGGWWYSHCQHVNINGKYALGLTWFDSARNEWIAVATSEMRLRRRAGCS